MRFGILVTLASAAFTLTAAAVIPVQVREPTAGGGQSWKREELNARESNEVSARGGGQSWKREDNLDARGPPGQSWKREAEAAGPGGQSW